MYGNVSPTGSDTSNTAKPVKHWVPHSPERNSVRSNSISPGRSLSRSPLKKTMTNSAVSGDNTSKGAGNELAEKLMRRAKMSEPVITPKIESKAISWALNATAEFRDFTRSELEQLHGHFTKADTDENGTIGRDELRKLLERLGYPQTHAALNAMMKEVDEDHDGQITLRQFVAIYRASRKGPIEDYKELRDMNGNTESIDVSSVGVGGAKSFFESKAKQLQRSSEVAQEVKKDREARKAAMAEAQQRKMEFKEKMSKFKGSPSHS